MGNGQGKPVDLTGEGTCKNPRANRGLQRPSLLLPAPTCLARGAKVAGRPQEGQRRLPHLHFHSRDRVR